MFEKSVVWADKALAASSSYQEDLPAVPLSHLIFTLKGLNVTDEATLTEILARITNISVKDLGVTIFSMSGADLFAFNCVFMGKMPILTNRDALDNTTRAITLILPFGRRLYDPGECYPAKPQGNLKFYLDTSATETAIDGLIAQLEAVNLPGAGPASFLKTYTKTFTAAATGLNSVDLERGNKLAGVLVYGTTVPLTTAWTASIEDCRLMANNKEHVIALTYWESLHGGLLERCGYIGDFGAAFGDDLVVNYGFMNFFPLGDDQHLIETNGLLSFKFQYTAGVADAIRLLPMEVVAVG